MIKREIGTRYANALFALAREKDILDAVERDFPPALRLTVGNPELKAVLEHPAIGNGEKKNLIEPILKDRINETLFDFINLLIDKKRESYLGIIKEDFDELLREHRGMRIARVFTPFELSSGLRQTLIDGLSKSTGKTVEIEEVVDPSLIGGIRVQIGDKVFDGSIRSRLAQVRESLGRARIQ